MARVCPSCKLFSGNNSSDNESFVILLYGSSLLNVMLTGMHVTVIVCLG